MMKDGIFADVTHDDDAADARFNVPHVTGDHIGNDHQEAARYLADPVMGAPGNEFWTQGGGDASSLPRREPGRMFQPAFGLQWHAPDGTVRHNLADFPWENNRRTGVETSNIELRTIYAHLIEAATLVRQEMRDRGLVVDL